MQLCGFQRNQRLNPAPPIKAWLGAGVSGTARLPNHGAMVEGEDQPTAHLLINWFHMTPVDEICSPDMTPLHALTDNGQRWLASAPHSCVPTGGAKLQGWDRGEQEHTASVLM